MMTKKLVIFGSGEMAELSKYYFDTDSPYEVVAFTKDSDFITEEYCLGLPVVPFETIQDHYPPEEYALFIALGYSKLNQVRKEKYELGLKNGYSMASYVSTKATVLSDRGIGKNCFILENNTIQPFVKIGDNVTLWSGNHVGHHSVVGNHTFCASHVVISGGVEIGEQCFIGVNATLRDRIKIGSKSVIGAGALILHSVEPDSLFIGSKTKKSQVTSGDLKKI